MSWLTVSNVFSASTVRSSKSRLNFLYINIVSDAINAVNLQRGILTPVLKKKKDKTLPGNYRGIVVTNTFSNIIESVIKERLEKQLLLSVVWFPHLTFRISPS
jgi:hypothetical protein